MSLPSAEYSASLEVLPRRPCNPALNSHRAAV